MNKVELVELKVKFTRNEIEEMLIEKVSSFMPTFVPGYWEVVPNRYSYDDSITFKFVEEEVPEVLALDEAVPLAQDAVNMENN
jgi:hypothetical protein